MRGHQEDGNEFTSSESSGSARLFLFRAKVLNSHVEIFALVWHIALKKVRRNKGEEDWMKDTHKAAQLSNDQKAEDDERRLRLRIFLNKNGRLTHTAEREERISNLEVLRILRNGTGSDTELASDNVANAFRHIRWTIFCFWSLFGWYHQVRYDMCGDLVVGLNEGREEAEQRIEGDAGHQRWVRDVVDIVQKTALDLWECDGRRKLEEQGESR